MSDTALAQSGVKGMHWGTRKAPELPMHSSYSKHQARGDEAIIGRQGVRKINQRLHKGEGYDSAKKAEYNSFAKKRIAVAGALLATHILLNHGGDIHKDFANYTKVKAATNRDEAATRSEKPSEPKFVKPNRKGVHKLHSF